MSDFDFDYKDYAVRQFRMGTITFAAWATVVICGLVIKYGGITDENTGIVIIFLGATSTLVFVFGIYAHFVAWAEKKLFQYKKKIDDDSS